MHFVKLRVYSCQLLAILVAGNSITSSPTIGATDSSPDIVKRVGTEPSSYPYGDEYVNEMRWKDWDPQNQAAERADGQKLHEAYEVMKEMTVLAWHEADAKTATFKRWFGESDAEAVKSVLGRIMDMTLPVPEAQPRMREWVLERTDFENQCNLEAINGYSMSRGRVHICPRGLALPNLATMVCNDLQPYRGAHGLKMSSRRSRSTSGVMLHEAVHWEEIGDAALQKHITDVYGGGQSYKCHVFPPDQKLINAQNYAWLATEAYFQVKGCMFTNPIFGTKDEEENDPSPPAIPSPPENSPPPENKSEGRTFVVGLEQFEVPRCLIFAPPGINQQLSRKCSEQHDYVNKYFFYRLQDVDEVDSLCTSQLDDFYQDDQASTTDKNLFENPIWPIGEWRLNLAGEEFSYKNDGQSPGALWKGDHKIDCNGELKQHDPKSDEWCQKDLKGAKGTNRKRRRILTCKW